MSVRTRTPDEVKAEFKRRGISIAGWAVAHGVSTSIVHEVLAGRKKGLRGQSHKVAVLLGLKDGEVTEDLAKVDLRVKQRRVA